MVRSLFHRHQWTETERVTAPPFGGRMQGMDDAYLIERLALGVTTIIMTCSECGDKKTIEVLGGKS